MPVNTIPIFSHAIFYLFVSRINIFFFHLLANFLFVGAGRSYFLADMDITLAGHYAKLAGQFHTLANMVIQFAGQFNFLAHVGITFASQFYLLVDMVITPQGSPMSSENLGILFSNFCVNPTPSGHYGNLADKLH